MPDPHSCILILWKAARMQTAARSGRSRIRDAHGGLTLAVAGLNVNEMYAACIGVEASSKAKLKTGIGFLPPPLSHLHNLHLPRMHSRTKKSREVESSARPPNGQHSGLSWTHQIPPKKEH